MKRVSSPGRRFRLGFAGCTSARPDWFHAGVEPLEDRKMLSASDLLISTYDSFYGQTIYRYDDTTWTPAAGGVATGGAENAGTAYGVAAGLDGSFYVANNAAFPGSILHYHADGTFDDVVGAGDPTPFSTINPYFTPGTLNFGPNGHLYAGDLATNTLYEFDTTSDTQQFVGAQYLGYRPGGFTWAADGSNDLIVGDIQNHFVTRYSSIDNSPTLLIDPGDPDSIDDVINPSAIIAEPNNDLLIADFSFGGDELDHRRIVKYDASEGTTSTFIVLTDPTGTGDFDGFPAQPTSLIFEPGGATFLAGVSADHNLHGAVLRFDTATGAQIGDPVISGIGTPSGLAFTQTPSTVAGRHIFYNQSAWDGDGAGINFTSDNAAIATDKTAYLPGDPKAVAFNVTNYTRGINGIIIDLAGGGTHQSINAGDFVFKVGNNNTPSSWAAAPSTASIAVSLGGGVGGSDRVEITWASGAISNKWLEVQVLATSHTGLTSPDVFFWGNKLADSASGALDANNFITNSTDATQVFATLTPVNGATITNVRDYNRDKTVNSTDATIVFAQLGNLNRLLVGSAGPFAPEGGGGGGGDAGISSALAGAATSSADTGIRPAPGSVSHPVSGSGLGPARVTACFDQLTAREARQLGKLASDDDWIGNSATLDDELLDSLLEGSRL